MTSRGTIPLIVTTSSPAHKPARSAADPGATLTTTGADMGTQAIGEVPPVACERGRRSRSVGRATRVLRRRGDGDQSTGMDGPHLRAARLLLPRDRPQQGR